MHWGKEVATNLKLNTLFDQNYLSESLTKHVNIIKLNQLYLNSMML